jgi:hypothetical protein
MSYSKNPFELRFDTLALAKDMLDRQYDTAQTQMFEMIRTSKNSTKRSSRGI